AVRVFAAPAVPVFFSSRRRHTRSKRDWSSDVCSSDLQPAFAGVTGEKIADLRYGESPHQAAAVYSDGTRGIACATLLGGKAMSYNNYTDTDAAIRAAFDFDQPAVAIVKHANPCGIAVADTA